MDTTDDNVNDQVQEEISPLRSKMATLATRSSFASFFLKNKKNLPKNKFDPVKGKEDPTVNFGKNDIIISENNETDIPLLSNDSNIPIPIPIPIPINTLNPIETCDLITDESFPQKTEFEFISLDTSNYKSNDTIISENIPTVSCPPKRSNEEIIISDTEPVSIIDSDIEIILPRRRSQRRKTVKSPDIECISISSDDSGDTSKVADLRRSSRICTTTTPSNPPIPLSDYSNMKKLNFTKPATKPPVENIIISDSPVKQVPSPTSTTPITVNLNPPLSPNQSLDFVPSININFNQAPVRYAPIQSFNAPVVNRTSSASILKRTIPNQSSTAQPNNVPIYATKVEAILASSSSVYQASSKPSASAKTAYVPINRTPATSTSPVKSKGVSSYIPPNFNDLDPSLREELMARLSQRENSSSVNSSNTDEPTPTTNTNTSTYIAQSPDKFVIFDIIQRMIPGTFDPTKSSTGKLIQCNSFKTIFKENDTFGSLKRRLAEILRHSPYDLVLTQESGRGGATDQSELFDTTRPITLNIVGKTLEEYDRLNVNLHPNSQKSMAQTKSIESFYSIAANATRKTTPKNTFPMSANVNNPFMHPATPSNVSFTPPTLQLQQIPQSLVHRLYLYTKSSYLLYKSLQQTKKQQIYDSLTFLQTADEEMSKLSQDPVYQDEDLFNSMDMKISQSQATANMITINVKTANSRNQSHPVKISPTANITQLLQAFAAEYKITGTRVIFDGDVLKENDTIGNILEDDDMVEIK